MTTTLRAHFDGTVLVPEEAVDLPRDTPLRVTVEPAEPRLPILADPEKSLEEKLEAIRRTFSHEAPGVDLPAEALRREHMYGDDGR